MSFDFVSLVPRGDDPMAQVVISKADTTLEDHVGEKKTITKDDLAPEVVEYIDALEDENDELTKSVTDLTTERDAAVAKAEKIEKAAPDTDDFDTLIAKADPAVAKVLKQQRDQIEKAEASAKVERDARLDKEFISKAEALPMLAVEGEDNGLAGLLRRAADALTPEDSAKLEKMLATANTQIAKGGLFSESGSSSADTTISKSVRSRAEEIRKGEPTLTIEQAEARAYAENPDLFAQAMTQEA